MFPMRDVRGDCDIRLRDSGVIIFNIFGTKEAGGYELKAVDIMRQVVQEGGPESEINTTPLRMRKMNWGGL
jgi:hypothetical protein